MGLGQERLTWGGWYYRMDCQEIARLQLLGNRGTCQSPVGRLRHVLPHMAGDLAALTKWRLLGGGGTRALEEVLADGQSLQQRIFVPAGMRERGVIKTRGSRINISIPDCSIFSAARKCGARPDDCAITLTNVRETPIEAGRKGDGRGLIPVISMELALIGEAWWPRLDGEDDGVVGSFIGQCSMTAHVPEVLEENTPGIVVEGRLVWDIASIQALTELAKADWRRRLQCRDERRHDPKPRKPGVLWEVGSVYKIYHPAVRKYGCSF